jgi:ketosteroid isomerase-like protein
MTRDGFIALLHRFTAAVEAGDGTGFAACFVPDAAYHDYLYGTHRGPDAIARMLVELFHRDAGDYRWEMIEPVCDGDVGYASWLSSYASKLEDYPERRVVVEGMSRFALRDGLIAEYGEVVNGGVGMIQLGVPAARIEKVMRRWSDALLARPEVQAHRRGGQR